MAGFSLRTCDGAAWVGEIRELCRSGVVSCAGGCGLPTTNLGEGGVLYGEGRKCQKC